MRRRPSRRGRKSRSAKTFHGRLIWRVSWDLKFVFFLLFGIGFLGSKAIPGFVEGVFFTLGLTKEPRYFFLGFLKKSQASQILPVHVVEFFWAGTCVSVVNFSQL